MKWNIGNVKIKNQVGLAPMAGISNPSYMKICEEMGVGWAVTELISAEAIVRNNKKTLEMLNGIDTLNIPVGIQLFGSDPSTIAEASKILCEHFHHVALIDINMGCPVPKVAVKSQAGAALLKNPSKIKEIVSSVVESVSCPVTVKIRSGWDSEHINAVEVAKICEEAGASCICIHGRTRSQGYSGKADLDIIKKVKESVSIPVIGNGDIVDIDSAIRMLDYTHVDAIMIGRGVLGNPWLIRDINHYLKTGERLPMPTYEEKIDMAIKHLNNLKELKNEKLAVLEIRNHIAWYLKGLKNSSEIKNNIFKCNNIFDIIKILDNYKEELRKDEVYG